MDGVDLTGLPGEDLVRRGLADVAQGRDTPEATLLCLASRRLSALGLPVPPTANGELHLYRQLAARAPDRDPYPLYAAWLETLDSFLAAASWRARIHDRAREGA